MWHVSNFSPSNYKLVALGTQAANFIPLIDYYTIDIVHLSVG